MIPFGNRRMAVLVIHLGWLQVLAGSASAQAPAALLDGWDPRAAAVSRHELAGALREVSGLAVTTEGRVFAHNDERAEIHELDPATGQRLRRFGLGRDELTGDFEGLAWAEGRFFLISSDGTLHEFPEALDGERVEYRRHETGLGSVCDVEGLAFDARTRALLIACKTMYEDGAPAIYAFELAGMSLERAPRYTIRLPDGGELNPSGIVVHGRSGRLLLVAARQRLLIEMDRNGSVLATRELERRTHRQPEGIELLPDGSLVIADEGAGDPARLTVIPATPAGT